jgi:riboflavin synthase
VGDKLGGHFVTGHIDGVGELRQIEATATAWELTFGIPETLGPYLVPKGSIAINGISLTIAALEKDGIRVAVIPHTYAATNLKDLQLGDPVNVEGDILGKYVERYLEKYFHKSAQHSSSMESDLSLAFLQEHGYL